MSEMELYGLMAVAKEQQAAVQRAAEALEHARKALQADREGLSEIAAKAAQEAARQRLDQMVVELQKVADGAQAAILDASNNMQSAGQWLSLPWMLSAMGFGAFFAAVIYVLMTGSRFDNFNLRLDEIEKAIQVIDDDQKPKK